VGAGGGVGCSRFAVERFVINGLVASPAAGPFQGQSAVLVSSAMGKCTDTAVSHENQCCSANPLGCGQKFAWCVVDDTHHRHSRAACSGVVLEPLYGR
jgi:hypothetical protein